MLMRFIEPGRDLELALAESYDPVLVGCSVAAAVLAAYAAVLLVVASWRLRVVITRA